MWKLLVLSLFASSLGNIQDCSNGLSILKLTSLSLEPVLPIVNEPVIMTVQFENPGQDIINGTVTTAITYNFLPLSPLVEDLCINTVCPITPGFNDRSTNSTWPDAKGTLVSTIKWTAFDGSQLLCIKVSLKSVRTKLRGTSNISGISFFKDNGTGFCPLQDFLGKKIVIYRQWNKLKRRNPSRNPEDL